MSAYACEPGRGSEPGAGWAWACAAAREHVVWVLTHTTNQASISSALAEDPSLAQRLHPVFLANPGWVARLRRRGLGRYLYYWIWQLGPCRREARRLAADVGFDVCHHVTYASDWMPAGISALGEVPFVWGPVGGSSTRKVPRLWALLGARTFVIESARALVVSAVRRIVGRRLAQHAAAVVGQNADVATAFASFPVIVEPNIALDPRAHQHLRRADHDGPPRAVYAGRLVGLKGLRLALAALRRPEAAAWTLDLYGDGPQRQHLQRLAARWGLADRVRFMGGRPREEVRAALARADVLLFPSTRDAAGWSVAEATAAGCPVLCLGLGGPATLVGAQDGVVVDPRGDVVSELATGLNRARARTPRRDRWSATRLPAVLNAVYSAAQPTGGRTARDLHE